MKPATVPMASIMSKRPDFSRMSTAQMSFIDQKEGTISDVSKSLGMPLPPLESKTKPKVVILGSGWGGFNFGNQVSKDKYDVTIVSPVNHFLFTPLLCSTTVGTLEYNSI